MFIFLSLSALVSATVQQIVIQPVQACPLFRCASPQCRIAPCADGNRACDAVPTIESDGGKCCVG